MPSFFLPLLILSVSHSPPVKVAHSQVDGRHQKGWVRSNWDNYVRDTVWYRWRAMSLWESFSGHRSNWETTDDEEERIHRANTQGQDGHVEGLPWSKNPKGSEGSLGWAWDSSSALVTSRKLSKSSSHHSTFDFLSPKSFPTCGLSSSRSALTGPSCMHTLWPTALFDFVCAAVCACGWACVGVCKEG